MGGLFGATLKERCVPSVFYGTDYLSHLGTKFGGLAFSPPFGKKIHSIHNGYFRPKFEDDLAGFTGNLGIGAISDTDPQPRLFNSHLGTFALGTVGKINNLKELVDSGISKRMMFTDRNGDEVSQTEIAAHLINEESSFEDGIRRVQDSVEGSLSMVVLTRDGVYAARDKYGRTPLVIGRGEDGFCVSSETCSFPTLGFRIDKYLGPAETVKMDPDGYETRLGAGDKLQICTFLWVYYGFPSSHYEGLNVESVRYNCGSKLAQADAGLDIDFVAGIPDSGIAHAIGYSNESKIPYKRPFTKYTPTWPRSFMPQDQSLRDLVAKMKLIPIPELLEGQKVLFCEDSIVRGTQLKENVEVLYDLGVEEIHMRPACPALVYPCEHLNFSTSRSTLDLAARKAIQQIEGRDDADVRPYAIHGTHEHSQMVDRIRQNLDLTSLSFQDLSDLVDAVSDPRTGIRMKKKDLCTDCWDYAGGTGSSKS